MAYMDKKQPYRIVASGKKAERRDYSKVSGHLELPNLVEIQTDSFEWFKNCLLYTSMHFIQSCVRTQHPL